MIAYYSPAKRQRSKRHKILRVAQHIFLICGGLALGYAAYVVTEAHAYQAIEQSRFDNPGKTQLHGPAMDGEAIGEVEVPRLGVKVVFVQGDSPRILRRAVGHISDTALPGEKGNVVLTAHRDSFFRPLRHILTGDAIRIRTLDGEFEYKVESTQVVSPDDVQVLQPSSANTLTLVTCFPFYYVGPAPKRFIVHARQIMQSPPQSSAENSPSF